MLYIKPSGQQGILAQEDKELRVLRFVWVGLIAIIKPSGQQGIFAEKDEELKVLRFVWDRLLYVWWCRGVSGGHQYTGMYLLDIK